MHFLFWGIQSWEAIFFKKCILVLGHPNLENCYSFIQSTDDLLRDRSNLSQVRKYQFYKLSIKGFRSSQPILRLKCRPRETRVVGYGFPPNLCLSCASPHDWNQVWPAAGKKNKGFTFVEAVEFKVNFLQNCFPSQPWMGQLYLQHGHFSKAVKYLNFKMWIWDTLVSPF